MVHYSAFKGHCSFFAGRTAILAKFSKETRPFLFGKTTLRFTPERPIPATLIKRIVRERIATVSAEKAKAGSPTSLARKQKLRPYSRATDHPEEYARVLASL